MAVLAEVLSAGFSVDLVHHRTTLTPEHLQAFSGADLSKVRFRYVPPEDFVFGTSYNPYRRYQQARHWHATLSDPYDLFISIVHFVPPFCQAPNGVLIVLFPFYEAHHIECLTRSSVFSLWGEVKRRYHTWEWKRRMSGYQLKLAISEFSREWARRRWGIDCEVLNPPVNTDVPPTVKADIILSVARFGVVGHPKHQETMVAAFQQMDGRDIMGWRYVCAGGLGGSLEDRKAFEKIRSTVQTERVQLMVNLERAKLKELYGRSKVFWHAAGYSVDEKDHPELAEHFGLVTVEAMAAGCVPVVVNKGGQREIVEHGISGFLWDTLDDLKMYTELLSRDDGLRSRLAQAARVRALEFGKASFARRFERLLRRSVPNMGTLTKDPVGHSFHT